MFTHTELIDGTLLAQVMFTFSFLVSSFVVSSNDYAGFLVVFTGLVFAAFIGFTYYSVRKAASRTMYGVVLGGLVVLTFISLQTAIFWGQYGNCESEVDTWAPTYAPTASPESRRMNNVIPAEIESIQHIGIHMAAGYADEMQGRVLYSHFGIECYRTHAMKSVCAFSVFMFLSYIALVGLLFKYKNDILGASPLDETLPPLPSLSAFMGGKAQNEDEVGNGSDLPQSADL